jgi:hypothetical protein
MMRNKLTIFNCLTKRLGKANPAKRISSISDPYQDGVGSTIYDAAIAEDFMNAFYALQPWDDWHNPDYLDEL